MFSLDAKYINVRDSVDPVFWNVQDGAAVTGLMIAAASLVAVNTTGNAIYDPIGSIVVGNLLGMVCLACMQLWANNIFFSPHLFIESDLSLW